MAAARCCISARRCSRFVATCMAIAIANAAIAGTVITTRNLRSIGRSANQRNNSPPPHRTGVDYDLTLMSAEGRKSADLERDQVHVAPRAGVFPRGLRECGSAAGGANTAARPFPVERGTRIGLASRRNVAVSYHPISGQSRVCVTEGGHGLPRACRIGRLRSPGYRSPRVPRRWRNRCMPRGRCSSTDRHARRDR